MPGADSEWLEMPEPDWSGRIKANLELRFPERTKLGSQLTFPPRPNVPQDITEIVSIATMRRVAILWSTVWMITLLIAIYVIMPNIFQPAYLEGPLLLALISVVCLLAWVMTKVVGPSKVQKRQVQIYAAWLKEYNTWLEKTRQKSMAESLNNESEHLDVFFSLPDCMLHEDLSPSNDAFRWCQSFYIWLER